tara:strand:+ start:19234 stop:19662 length:429 start_codon:yes stop_codon:yes gene_type:complete
MPAELRIIRRGNMFHGFRNGSQIGVRSSSVVGVFEQFYPTPSVTEYHTFEKVEHHIFDGMCLWLYGNDGWWFARIGGVQFEDIGFDNTDPSPDPQQFSRFAATSFLDYSLAASRVNWTDAISRLAYEYEQSIWWRDIHNAGT